MIDGMFTRKLDELGTRNLPIGFAKKKWVKHRNAES
jgi:hypothetical protein